MPTPQITITGHLQDIFGVGNTAASLRVQLVNFGSQCPRVTGTGLLAPTAPLPVAASGAGGAFSFQVYGNDVIVPGPNVTYYQVQILDDKNDVIQVMAYQFTGTASLDLASVVPLITAPGTPVLANSLSIGVVTTLAPGASATASITGLAPAQLLNLGIPQGAAGTTTATGVNGNFDVPGQLIVGTGPWVDPRDPQFAGGAKCDGVTDDSAALTAAINSLPLGGGGNTNVVGTILIYGRMLLASSITLKSGIRFLGMGGMDGGYSINGRSEMIYSGTGTRGFDGRGLNGVVFQNIAIRYSNGAFAGSLLDYSAGGGGTNTAEFTFRDCNIRGPQGVYSAAKLVDYDVAIIGTFERVYFQNAVAGCSTDIAGHGPNAIQFLNCLFDNFSDSALQNFAQMCSVIGCTFEGTASPMRAYRDTFNGDPGCSSVWIANWFGDWTTNTDAWINMIRPAQFTFRSNFMGGNSFAADVFGGAQRCIKFRDNGASVNSTIGTITIEDNTFVYCTIELINSGVKPYYHDAISIQRNSNPGNGIKVVNTAGHMNLTIRDNSPDASDAFANLPIMSHRGNLGLGMEEQPAFGIDMYGGQTRLRAIPAPNGAGENWFGAGQGQVSASYVGVAGATTYTYIVFAKDRNGKRSYPGITLTVPNCAAVLDSTHHVDFFVGVADEGVAGYDVCKTNTSTFLLSLAHVVGNLNWRGSDTGQGTGAYTPPTHAESADLDSDSQIRCAHLLPNKGGTPTITVNANWGATSSGFASPTGNDHAVRVTITANGAGIAANPTVIVTFAQPWDVNPNALAVQTGGTGALQPLTVTIRSLTSFTFQWNGTPVAGQTYEMTFFFMGV